MVAYSFNKQFEEAIVSGYKAYMEGGAWLPEHKSHTIRLDRKRHARPGENVQLYTGMRTKHCRKLVDPDPICLYCVPITINPVDDAEMLIRVDGKPINDLETFARADGFSSAKAMSLFWHKFHPTYKEEGFAGRLIGWGSPDEWELWHRLYSGYCLTSDHARHQFWMACGALVEGSPAAA